LVEKSGDCIKGRPKIYDDTLYAYISMEDLHEEGGGDIVLAFNIKRRFESSKEREIPQAWDISRENLTRVSTSKSFWAKEKVKNIHGGHSNGLIRESTIMEKGQTQEGQID
jgi:hypothetical protein